MEEVRTLLLELHDRKGWKVLGYGSWRECVDAEFAMAQTTMYRHLEAAKIEREISQVGNFGKISDSALLALADLPDAETRRRVWQRAREIADARVYYGEATNRLKTGVIYRTIVEQAVHEWQDAVDPKIPKLGKIGMPPTFDVAPLPKTQTKKAECLLSYKKELAKSPKYAMPEANFAKWDAYFQRLIIRVVIADEERTIAIPGDLIDEAKIWEEEAIEETLPAPQGADAVVMENPPLFGEPYVSPDELPAFEELPRICGIEGQVFHWRGHSQRVISDEGDYVTIENLETNYRTSILTTTVRDLMAAETLPESLPVPMDTPPEPEVIPEDAQEIGEVTQARPLPDLTGIEEDDDPFGDPHYREPVLLEDVRLKPGQPFIHNGYENRILQVEGPNVYVIRESDGRKRYFSREAVIALMGNTKAVTA